MRVEAKNIFSHNKNPNNNNLFSITLNLQANTYVSKLADFLFSVTEQERFLFSLSNFKSR